MRRFVSYSNFLTSFHSHSLFRVFSHSLHQFIPNNSNVDDAVFSFHRMLNMRPTPSIVEFNTILGFLVRTKNHYATTISLYHRLEFNQIQPCIVTLNTIINCYCHTGQMRFAFSVFAKILKIGYQPHTITLNTLIKGLCLNGKVHEALHFHDHVVAHGFRLDRISYGTLINGLCKIGETRAAVKMLRQIDGKLVKVDVVMHNIINDSLCKDKFVMDAYELYCEMIAKKIVGV
ncbi:putative pentatricopeptide repeat-containing protein At1g12700, mitochondrial [Lathyrus oleraceus]|uniref:putative pentatricopeptide repeat-containing protein At1g12700, mitochondrial n=1 Tax=Pisum sativum TaxID=3888 RepID=UPI0021CFFFB3|nr:putative pentatricopeptide repeat-containing protein At1g12700, mitochondrial [Pisum sativum]